MSRRTRRWLIGGTVFVLLAVAAWFFVLAPNGDIRDYTKNHSARPTELPGSSPVKVTFLGTTTLLLEDDSTKLMIDGFLTRPGKLRVLLGELRTDTARVNPVLRRVGATRVKALFVVHSHLDHVLDAAYVARYTGATLYGSPSTLNVGRGGGLRRDQMEPYRPGQELKIGDFRVTVLHASHSPQPRIFSDAGHHILDSLPQPAKRKQYREGGSYDLLVRHDTFTILIKPSANFIPGALDSVRAHVVLLSTAQLGQQDSAFWKAYYAETVGKVEPKLVIPIHWDDFSRPLSDELRAPPRVADDLPKAFDFLIDRTGRDTIQFRILQGYQSVLLFGPGSSPSARTPSPRPPPATPAGRAP